MPWHVAIVRLCGNTSQRSSAILRLSASCDPAILRSCDPAILRSCDPAIVNDYMEARL